jgi:hypothetical protein
MNKNALKSYAPRARRDFIAAVTARAAKFGVSPQKVEPIRVEGDFAIIGGTPFPRTVADQRRRLEGRIAAHGFAQVMEAAAYTWFNRLAAIRYMEIHGYLDHGYRVLSHPTGKSVPEVIEQADHVDLPGLNRDKVVELKLDGRKDEDLYRMLLIAQCNALHAAMPFLFERIDDETELLLPDNLLHTDSLIRQMVAEIDEDDWKEIEIIGWLYQFYIAERKDEVIGKVVKSEDIPAATQLFTPNWIVKYMVQNSLGAKWLATYPNSPLRAKMKYYIEPAEQTDEINRQLAAITPAELDPEKLTMIDPACGSGHIIVEGYDLLKEIYLERGYTLRQIPRLILDKNLFGLDIDDRAAQMAGFAILMKARADDRYILSPDNPPNMNVMAIQDSKGLDANQMTSSLSPRGRFDLVPSDDLMPQTLAQPTLSAEQTSAEKNETIESLIDLFAKAKTFGSLITVPENIAQALPALKAMVEVETQDDIFQREAKQLFALVVKQAEVLSGRYDAVVANPPYMGSGFMPPDLKKMVGEHYSAYKTDLYSCFINRNRTFTRTNGHFSIVTMQGWMFLGSFFDLRDEFLAENYIMSLLHMANGVMGIAFKTCVAAFQKTPMPDFVCTYKRIDSSDIKESEQCELSQCRTFQKPIVAFNSVPSKALAYSLTPEQLRLFRKFPALGERLEAREGLTTADNDRFLRYFWEVSNENVDRGCSTDSTSNSYEKKWYPYQKGGAARKWFGNNEWIVNWKDDGAEIKNNVDVNTDRVRSHNYNGEYSFKEGISWSSFSNGGLSFRYVPQGYLFDSTGSMAFSEHSLLFYLGYLNSSSVYELLSAYSPSPRQKIESMLSLPDLSEHSSADSIAALTRDCVQFAKQVDSKFETSPEFSLSRDALSAGLASLSNSINENRQTIYALETRIEAQVASMLGMPPPAASTNTIDAEEFSATHLISLAIGCMMGRYSLAEPGLIYAHAGNEGFDPSRYGAFPANDDGIAPITDDDWFADDAANKFVEFLKIAQSPETILENLKFIAEGLGSKASETPLDTVRRYLSRDFFKEHLQTYKNRPIYWLFSSGKEKAFECLVYLHRYNAGTLSRMRMEYVVPLQGRMRAKIEQVDAAAKEASSTAAQTKLRKELEKLKKKQAELVKFDEELRHFADRRIELDLDYGVKVNYAKFGNLLSEVKKISGDDDE